MGIMGGVMDFLGGDIGTDTGDSERFTREGVGQIRGLRDETQELLNPFIGAGQGAISGLQQQHTPGSMDAILGQIFGSGNFQNLRDERMRGLQNQMSAGGFMRSGTGLQEMANVPTELGFGIENLLTGRNTQNLNTLFGGGLNAATSMGGFNTQAGGQIGNLFGGQAGIEFQAANDAAQRRADFVNTQTTNASNMASSFFSDSRFKENITEVGEIGPLKIYRWDWNEFVNPLLERVPALKSMFMSYKNGRPIGFMAHQVKKLFPQFVQDVGGIMFIDYGGLLGELGEI